MNSFSAAVFQHLKHSVSSSGVPAGMSAHCPSAPCAPGLKSQLPE
jgi:hypothetical protein